MSYQIPSILSQLEPCKRLAPSVHFSWTNEGADTILRL